MDDSRDIEIALKPSTQNSQRTLPENINLVLRNEYATKYLEKINVYPTKNNIESVLQNVSIEKATIKVNWARERIYINPFGLSKPETAVRKSSTVEILSSGSPGSLSRSSAVNDDSNDDDDDDKKGKVDKTDYKKKFDAADLSEPLLRILKHNRQTANSFKCLMSPPDIDQEDILQPIRNFISSIGEFVPTIKLDTTGDVFKSVKKLLTSPQTIRLMGLLVHFCYWNVIHPSVREAIIESRKSEHGYNSILGRIYDEVDLDLSTHISDRQSIPSVIKEHNGGGKSISPSRPTQAVNDVQDMNGRGIGIGNSVLDQQQQQENGVLNDEGTTAGEESVMGMGSITGDTVATESSLAVSEKETLYLQLEFCLIEIFKKLGSRKTALVIGRQSLISCCHFAVDDVFTTLYPWFSSILTDKSSEETMRLEQSYNSGNQNVIIGMKELNLKLRRLLHQGLSELIDPTRLYTSPSMLNSLVGSTRGFGYKSDRKNKHYNTSTAIKAVFGDTKSDQTKRFFQQSSGLFISLPGTNEPYVYDTLGREGGTGGDGEPGAFLPDRIDFNNLFTDQDSAEYYPTCPVPPGTGSEYRFRGGETGTMERARDLLESRNRESREADERRPSSSRGGNGWQHTGSGDEWAGVSSRRGVENMTAGGKKAVVAEMSALLDRSRANTKGCKLRPIDKMKQRKATYAPPIAPSSRRGGPTTGTGTGMGHLGSPLGRPIDTPTCMVMMGEEMRSRPTSPLTGSDLYLKIPSSGVGGMEDMQSLAYNSLSTATATAMSRSMVNDKNAAVQISLQGASLIIFLIFLPKHTFYQFAVSYHLFYVFYPSQINLFTLFFLSQSSIPQVK